MKIYQVDAFTHTLFSGNPAGVCLVDEFPDISMMQNIAAEMNLSETAFVKHSGDTEYEIRFFTPTDEIDLCGHATLSSAHILFSENIIPLSQNILFRAKGGDLVISKGEQGYTMNFPLRSYSSLDKVEEAQTVTGIENIGEVYSTNKKWKIILVNSLRQLKTLEPNFFKMKGTEYGNVVVTCLGDEKYDYYMRCFVTDCGINEDPVTGSIECVLAPFWSKRLGKDSFFTYQCSKRGGEKRVELLPERVNISGEAITVFKTDI